MTTSLGNCPRGKVRDHAERQRLLPSCGRSQRSRQGGQPGLSFTTGSGCFSSGSSRPSLSSWWLASKRLPHSSSFLTCALHAAAWRLKVPNQHPLGLGSSRLTQQRRRAPSTLQCIRAEVMPNRAPAQRMAPHTAWTPLRSFKSLSKFAAITLTATGGAWFAHPHLLDIAAHVLHLDFKDSVTAFQTSFFSFLSLCFAIYSGNTMAFLYDRQKELVKNLYHECMALEELLEEAVHVLGPDARDILAQIQLYIEEEIYLPENQSPPLGEGFPLTAIRSKARNYRRAGTDVGEILQATQRLAHAQSERQATACRLLPPMHWALLYTIGSLFVSTFILFETGGSFSNEGRHILFTVLCGLMSFVLCALRDLADPVEGVYNATALLEERLAYLNGMLEKHRKLPGRLGNPSPTYLYSTNEVAVDQPTAGSRQRPFADESGSAALPTVDLSSLASSAAQFVVQNVPLLSGEGTSKPFEPRFEPSEQSESPSDSVPTPSSNPAAAKEPASLNGSSRSSGAISGSTDLFAPSQRFVNGQQRPQANSSFTAQPSWAWDRPNASMQGSQSRPLDLERDTYDGFEL